MATSANLAHAQQATYRFKRISRDQGLSHSTVHCIFQDSKGFMWFGTDDGLDKYNGYEFREYKVTAEAGGLSNNRILAIHEDKDGALWVGTEGGLNRMDPDTGLFEWFKPDPDQAGSLSHSRVRTIFQDSQGILWVGTGGGGLNRFDPETRTFKVYRRNPSKAGSLSHNRVRVIYEDRAGTLWVGTGSGLNRYDREKDQFTHFKKSSAPDSLSDNQINAIFEDRAGGFWIGTYDGGLNQMDRTTGTFQHYRHTPGKISGLASDTVSAVLEDRDGKLWVATENGLDRFDWISLGFVHHLYDPGDPFSISDNRVSCLYQDRSGVFWIGTLGGGINKIERGLRRFDHFVNDPNDDNSLISNDVQALHEDRFGNLWIGTALGLDRYERGSDRFYHFNNDPSNPISLSSDDVQALLADRFGAIWAGTNGGGLNVHDPASPGRFVRYQHDPDQPGSLADNIVWTLIEDHRGLIWVGTENGLDRFDRATTSFVHYKSDPLTPNTLSSNVIWTLFEDRYKDLWIGTENGGLNRYNRDKDYFAVYRHDPDDPTSISHDVILSIHENRDGDLWIGTWGGGLNYFDRGTQEFRHFRKADGLPNEVIYGILSDDRGHLWLSTNEGIARFEPSTSSFKVFDVTDGLQGVEFNANACFRGKNGEMYFGGVNGLNVFEPNDLTENTYIPPVLITAFKKFNETVAQDIHKKKHYNLEHNDNYLSFEFVALDYTNPQKNRYAYQMEGVDQEWLQAGTRRFANYPKLAPGDYTFKVKGSNNNSVWNNEGVAINIHIEAPFWRTGWFYTLEVLAVLLFVTAIFLVQRNYFKHQESKALVALDLNRKTEELEEARQLQLSMVPKHKPDIPGLDMGMRMITATEVGGDYYDYYMNRDGSLTVAVGDATGHGVRAGTLVAAAKSLFLAMAEEHEPKVIINKSSAAMRAMGFKKMFMAMAIARFENRTMRLTVAGMPSVMIYRAASNQVETLIIKALPLGGVPFPYREETVQLEPGDVVLFQSDGLEEMFDPEDQLFGSDRVKRVFREAARKSPEGIIDALVDAGNTWARGHVQQDDMTFMVVKLT